MGHQAEWSGDDLMVVRVLGWCGKHLTPLGVSSVLEDSPEYVNLRAEKYRDQDDRREGESEERKVGKEGRFAGRMRRSRGTLTSD